MLPQGPGRFSGLKTRARSARAFFTLDAAVALMLVVLILLVGATALSVNAKATISSDARISTATRVADALANKCAGEGGLAKCGGYLQANELGEADLLELSVACSEKTGMNVTVFVGEAPGGVCAYRLYLQGGAVVKAGACVK